MSLAGRKRQRRCGPFFRVRAIALVLLSSLACSQAGESPQRAGRVFLIGVDGASPRVVEPLRAAGRLPNLDRIAREGTSGTLRSFAPLMSPRIWTTIATGKLPATHGILGFRLRDADGKWRLYRSTDRRTHALWNIASAAGLRVGVVNWWTSHPVERVRGVMVSDRLIGALFPVRGRAALDDPEALVGTGIFPASWQERLMDAATAAALPGEASDFLLEATDLPSWVDREALSVHLRTDAAVVRCALAIEADLSPDLLMVFLPGTDRVSHWLWGSLEPAEIYPERLRPGPAERAAGREALYRYYAYVDMLIGLLIEAATPDDLVIVVSDHGFEGGTVRRRPALTGRHESAQALNAVLFARGPGISPGAKAAGTTVKDITPTILTWLGLPLARDMDGRVAPFLALHRQSLPRPVASYDTRPIERLVDPSDPDSERALEAGEEELLEQLRALGYLDD